MMLEKYKAAVKAIKEKEAAKKSLLQAARERAAAEQERSEADTVQLRIIYPHMG